MIVYHGSLEKITPTGISLITTMLFMDLWRTTVFTLLSLYTKADELKKVKTHRYQY